MPTALAVIGGRASWLRPSAQGGHDTTCAGIVRRFSPSRRSPTVRRAHRRQARSGHGLRQDRLILSPTRTFTGSALIGLSMLGDLACGRVAII